MIGKDRIEPIKQSVDLKALVEAKGITLKKNGKSWFGLCPFHADKNPSLSINPVKNLFQCFGCGAAGDVIRFVEMFDQADSKEAVKCQGRGKRGQGELDCLYALFKGTRPLRC